MLGYVTFTIPKIQSPYSENYNTTVMFQPYSPIQKKEERIVPTFLRNLLKFLNMKY